MARRRVLMALMFFPRGGSAHVNSYMARFLPESGWDVTLVTGEPFVHSTDRAGIVAHWASMSFVATLPDGQRTQLLAEIDGMLARRGIDEIDIPYRAELWVTRRRPDRAQRADRRVAAS